MVTVNREVHNKGMQRIPKEAAWITSIMEKSNINLEAIFPRDPWYAICTDALIDLRLDNPLHSGQTAAGGVLTPRRVMGEDCGSVSYI